MMLERVLEVGQLVVYIGHWELSTIKWTSLNMIKVYVFTKNDLSVAQKQYFPICDRYAFDAKYKTSCLKSCWQRLQALLACVKS